MRRPSSREIALELLGNAYIIGVASLWLYIFVMEEVQGVWEPSTLIRRVEMVVTIGAVLLGVERMVKDLWRFTRR